MRSSEGTSWRPLRKPLPTLYPVRLRHQMETALLSLTDETKSCLQSSTSTKMVPQTGLPPNSRHRPGIISRAILATVESFLKVLAPFGDVLFDY